MTQPTNTTARSTRARSSAKARRRGRNSSFEPEADGADPLEQAFKEELARALDGEKQALAELPGFIAAAKSLRLRAALEQQVMQTREHIKRAQIVFKLLERPAQPLRNVGFRAFLGEGRKLCARGRPGTERDLLLVAVTRKLQHCEISAYATLSAWSRFLGERRVLNLLSHLLERTLGEERELEADLREISRGILIETRDKLLKQESKWISSARLHLENDHRLQGSLAQEEDRYDRFEAAESKPGWEETPVASPWPVFAARRNGHSDPEANGNRSTPRRPEANGAGADDDGESGRRGKGYSGRLEIYRPSAPKRKPEQQEPVDGKEYFGRSAEHQRRRREGDHDHDARPEPNGRSRPDERTWRDREREEFPAPRRRSMGDDW